MISVLSGPAFNFSSHTLPAPAFLLSTVLAVHFKLASDFKMQVIEKKTLYIIHNYNTLIDFYVAKGTIPLQLFWDSKTYFRYVFILKSKT